MEGVIIEVFPRHATVSGSFLTAVRQAVSQRQSTLHYKGALFHIRYHRGGVLKEVKAVLRGVEASLPLVFRGELEVNFVTLRCPAPPHLKAKAGWYSGYNFGFPDANCCVDPRGETSQGSAIYAIGGNFSSVISLFKRVMTGELQPGHNGDKWSKAIRR